jgi:hypothetical protein
VTTLSLAIALTRAWTATYTRGLPTDTRAERRQEIDCDLWEHQRLADLEREPITGTALAILLRFLLGIPADIVWRLETGVFARSGRGTYMKTSAISRVLLTTSLVVVALVPLFSLRIVLRGSAGDALATAVYSGLPILAVIAIVFGLLTAPAKPGRGVALVAIGSLVIAVAWFWFFMITIPVGIALVTLTVFRGRAATGSGSGTARAQKSGASPWQRLLSFIGLALAAVGTLTARAVSFGRQGRIRRTAA